MGVGLAIALAINIFVIFLVGLIVYITFLAFSKRSNRNESILDIIKRTWSSERGVDKAIKGVKYGDLGSFVGYQSPYEESLLLIKDMDTQDYSEFMNQEKPNRIGIPP